MGVVFAGTDRDGRRAAVKLIHRELAHDPEFRQRFSKEIDLLQRVGGRFTVCVLDADDKAPQPWLATEYVPGPTLAQHVDNGGPLGEEQLRALAAGLAEALWSMHAAGVIHRDLKPTNVILSPTGPRVIDMGVARALEESSVTGTGAVVGSPGWISPEEYRGDEVGPPADVYGWALLLLFAATGRLPYGMGRPEVLSVRVLTETPSAKALPPALRGLVEGALSKDPAGRPGIERLLRATTGEGEPERAGQTVRDDVTRFVERTWVMPLGMERAWTSPAPGIRRRNKTALIAGGVVAIAAVLAAGMFIARGGGQGSARLASAGAPPTATASASTTGSEVPPTTTPPAVAVATASPSIAPVNGGKRKVVLSERVSFSLPEDWTYFMDPAAGPQSICMFPKGVADRVGSCGEHGIFLHTWRGSATPPGRRKLGDDPDVLNQDVSGDVCYPSGPSRKGTMLKSGLHRINDRRAYYRHARSHCKDGSLVEREYLLLPISKVYFVVDSLSKKHRAQAEEILQSFKFPNKPQ
ncbi:hypothetical protein Ssi02_75980 [Sinosporangium siamense]|uniref:Protein kinase domain-containing protein n=2 Tax=Sinosporangium siamense TaxID=1367973 RepID=A0A919VC93_9ACTN|nr:hypothetical protein Ssi02_75980 [Sinosporangium siamense]